MATGTPITSLPGKGIDLVKKILEPKKTTLDLKRESCERAGGQWDSLRNICIMPQFQKQEKTEPVEAQKVNPAKGTVETFRNKEGRLSGVTLPDGRTFLGLSPNEVNKIAQGEAEKTALPENAAPVGTAQNQANIQARNQQLVQLAQQGLLTPQELQTIQGSEIDIGQAIGAGATAALPGLAGVGAGLALSSTGVGAIAGVPIATAGVISAGAAIAGFLTSVKSNIKSQQTGEFAADKQALTKGISFLNTLITDTNKNPQNAPENIALFYQTLNMIDAAHVKTWKDSQEDLNRFLGNDGTPELARFETFDNTLRAYYISQFEQALIQPNPNKLLITIDELQGFEEIANEQ